MCGALCGCLTQCLGSSLKELNQEEFHYEVVKRAITISMDKNDKERELVSRLLSNLYLNGLTPSQISMGFRRVLLLADDLQIDIPTYVFASYLTTQRCASVTIVVLT